MTLAHFKPTTNVNSCYQKATGLLITQRSRVQIPPPQPNPAKSIHPRSLPTSAIGYLAPLWPTAFSPGRDIFRSLKFSTLQDFYPPEIQCDVVDTRLALCQKYSFPMSHKVCTFMVRCTHFVLLFLRWLVSLFSLCVALLCAIGDRNEITSSFICRFGSRAGCRLPRVCVDASFRRTCACSARASRRSPAVSPVLWPFRKEEVARQHGASVRGRLAH